MALNSAAVRVGITGELYSAPVGTAAPTTSVSALNVAFDGQGYVSEDGVKESYEDTIEEIVSWQNATVVRAVTTKSVAKLELTLIETKGKSLQLYHKGSVVAVVSAGQWKIDVKGGSADPRAFVLDVLDGTKHIRLSVANGEVTERGEITYANDGTPISYPITITCYADANGIVLTKFSDDANWGYS
jgi:hypothetical protein